MRLTGRVPPAFHNHGTHHREADGGSPRSQRGVEGKSFEIFWARAPPRKRHMGGQRDDPGTGSFRRTRPRSMNSKGVGRGPHRSRTSATTMP